MHGRSGGAISLLYLDLDGFKAVNDRYGHPTGDRLLVEVATRPRDVVRDADSVARLGGDEFAILLEGIDAATAVATAERVVDALHEPVSVGSGRLRVHASVGIADTEHARTPDELVLFADLAMYVAKARSPGHYQRFRPEHAANLPTGSLRFAIRGRFPWLPAAGAAP